MRLIKSNTTRDYNKLIPTKCALILLFVLVLILFEILIVILLSPGVSWFYGFHGHATHRDSNAPFREHLRHSERTDPWVMRDDRLSLIGTRHDAFFTPAEALERQELSVASTAVSIWRQPRGHGVEA
jgi:hypothetical protein